MPNGTLNKGSLVKGLLKNANSSSGGGGATNALYDLTTSEATKNWCTINGNSRLDLDKADVPTLYADILSKYNNADSGTGELTAATSAHNPVFYMDGYYYYALQTSSSSPKRFEIYKSANVDLSSPTLVYQTEQLTVTFNQMPILIKGDDVIILIHGNGSSPNFRVFDLEFNLLFSDVQSTNVADIISQAYRGYFTFYKNKLYFWSKQSPCCYDYVNKTLTSFGTFGSNERMCSDLIIVDDYLYFTKARDTLNRININTGTAETLALSDMGYYASSFFIYNGELKLLDQNKILTINTTNFTVTSVATSTVLTGISLGAIPFVKQIENTYYLCVKNNIYTTTNWQTFTLFMENVELLSTNGGDYVTYGYYYSHSGFYFTENAIVLLSQKNGNGSIWGASDGYYYYATLSKTVYTDTYTINSTETAINYYKNGGFKICVPDTTNDANLATVYTALGELPYFRLDTTGETVSPIRSKMYSAMYVGDEYEEE